MELAPNMRIVIGNSNGNGGTSRITNSFTDWLLIQNESYGIELYSGGEIKVTTPPKIDNSVTQSQCFVVDSKIALICIFFFRYKELTFNLFTWNHSDFSFHFSQVMRDRKNVNVMDYFRRKNREFFAWNEEVMFDSSEKISPMRNLSREKSEIYFIGRLTFQKGVDRILKLAKQNSSLKFNIYGDGPLLKYVRRKKTDNVNVYGFHMAPFASISINDFIIIPSRYFEGVPLVLLEALHKDIRVISSGVGDLRLIESESHYLPRVGESYFEFSRSFLKRIVSANNCES
jgi:glycosyltransferase involved in cell wall biosynthesis